jgi:hypothetical protein
MTRGAVTVFPRRWSRAIILGAGWQCGMARTIEFSFFINSMTRHQ